ncbi:hypothetical protein [uncultured Roseibium sp.]|uniref:hypothetical protein n=1 Tax=uncultured Roseibium sp. TaxID=1936171 RepID=UPI00263A3282|nr:hypothetical protein [uncultured Roseibium sp.]
MTDNEQSRIAVLENEIKHLRENMEKMSRRQTEMYDLMMQTKGGWKTLAILAGISGLFGGVLVKLAPLLSHIPK